MQLCHPDNSLNELANTNSFIYTGVSQTLSNSAISITYYINIITFLWKINKFNTPVHMFILDKIGAK